jgi:DNA-nicking Smr family endonuclease
MNFADILNEWDKRTAGTQDANVGTLVKGDGNIQVNRAMERRRLLRKRPDAVIDLHGLSQDLAWEALDDFFMKSHSMGYEKVLIVHGKGNHSDNEGVLKILAGKFIEHCPFAGQSGRNNAAMGGSGATWVLLK